MPLHSLVSRTLLEEALISSRDATFQSLVLRESQQGSPQLFSNFFVRNGLSSHGLGLTFMYSIEHIQMVEHVVDRAVIGEPFQERSDRVLGLHTGEYTRFPQTCPANPMLGVLWSRTFK